MQLRLPVAIAIFLGSYLPLSVILLVQDVDYGLLQKGICWRVWSKEAACAIPLAHPIFSLVAFGICLSSFFITLFALSLTSPKLSIKVTEAKYIPAELMSYTLPYVVSFMSIGYQETGKFIGITIFLAWMFWITHKSGQVLVNPLLAVLGWRLYEIKYSFPGDGVLYMGRALVKGTIEPEHSYPHAVVQDMVILKPKIQTDEE